ncbi:NAD-dependent epimerase/dehydratase family protein [Actinosynnema sp. NPDC020468]|uniref:NAD-dependent epimerase/dehydratase family protein n=1 Tax=Actinosynnema sp. NPDC020468 TaxID=3154488 RepID=UPI0033D8E392
MRIVVTGATGGVGTALLRRLAEEPGVRLHGVVRRPPAAVPPYRDVEWTPLDLSRDGAEVVLGEVLEGADALVHLDWRVQPGHDEQALYRTNVAGSARAFDAAVRAKVPHLVHLSSVGAYSPAPKTRPKDESWPTDGIRTSSYSRHKVALERMLDQIQADHPELLITRVRPGLVLHPITAREARRHFLGGFVPEALFRIRPAVLPLPAGVVLQVVHPDDVADGIALALRDRRGGPLNLVAQPPITPALLAEALGARHVAVPPSAFRGLARLAWWARLQPVSPGWVDLALTVPVLDAEQARAAGWEPRHDARDVLRQFLAGLAHGRGKQGDPPPRPV